MDRAQRDAEQWADENGMDRWSDGSLRENSEESIEDAEVENQAKMDADAKDTDTGDTDAGGSEEITEEQAAEMEAEAQETQAEADEITIKQSRKEADLSDYKIMIDGFVPNKNPLEGTKEMIGHYEYSDAQFYDDIQWAGDYKSATDGLYSDNMSDLNEALAGIHDARVNYRENREDTIRMSEYMHWSKDSFMEEYNPNAPVGEKVAPSYYEKLRNKK